MNTATQEKATHKFAAGEKVMAREYGGIGYRPAEIVKVSDYPHRGSITLGYEIAWLDLPARTNKYDPMPSSGGWCPETSIGRRLCIAR